MKATIYPPFRYLLLQRRDHGVLLVTLNRPDTLNAWSAELMAELEQFWPLAAQDVSVNVFVLTGAGKAFSVGGDVELLETFTDDAEKSIADSTRYTRVLRGMIDTQKPIIAAINGDVLGGGLGMALVCDVLFMAEHARIMCASQLNINVMPAPDAFLWPLRVAPARAKYHLFRSSMIDAVEAERIGLVSVVVPSERLMEVALEYAEEIAGRDPMMLGWTKRAMNFSLRAALPMLDEWLALEAMSFLRPEAKLGLRGMRRTLGRIDPD